MTRFEKWSVWLTSALTAITGVGYFWTKYVMVSDDPWAVIHSPLEPWFLRVHVVAAPALVFAVGMITTRHVWRHFRSRLRLGRRTGLSAAIALAPMILTGYLIQVITHPGWLRAMAWSHMGFGLLYIVGLGLHQWVMQRHLRLIGARERTTGRKRTFFPLGSSTAASIVIGSKSDSSPIRREPAIRRHAEANGP